MSRKQVKNALKISALVIKFLRDELSTDERLELETWLKADGRNKALLRRIFDEKVSREEVRLTEKFNADQAFNRLITNIRQNEHMPAERVIRLKPYYKAGIAAALLVMVSAGVFISYWGINKQDNTIVKAPKVQKAATEVVLTLANGRKVSLDKQQQGIITKQGSVLITKQNGSLNLSTQANNNNTDADNAINQIEIPRGKQYQLTLPDGSRVWLNAQTVLRFPGNFNSKERVLELSGEAYFEVAHFDSWPFRVKTKAQTVEVLGTHFNVNAYPEDGKTITTLESGSVKVYDAGASQILKPGQFAFKSNGKTGFNIATADLNETLGWKNGRLVFKDATIEELMQTVERTFDVDVDVDPQVKGRHFGGSYPVKNGLPNLLRNLEQTDVVHIKVNGRRISVMP